MNEDDDSMIQDADPLIEEDNLMICDVDDNSEAETVIATNPRLEELKEELNMINEMILKKKDELKHLQQYTTGALKELSTITNLDNLTCNLESEMDVYKINAEPIIKKKRTTKSKPLILKYIWQRVMDRKWIIGAVLENKSSWTLTDCCFYINFADKDEITGESCFWQRQNDFFWNAISEITPHSDEIMATVVLDVPDFEDTSHVESWGLILYKIEDKLIQLPVDEIKLSVRSFAKGDYELKLQGHTDENLVALKAISIEKTVVVDLQKKSGVSEKILSLLEDHSFSEVTPRVYVAKRSSPLCFSIIELFDLSEKEVIMRIYARSSVQRNIIIQMLRDEFPGLVTSKKVDLCAIAARTLLQELQLFFQSKNPAEWQRARVKTDLLIP